MVKALSRVSRDLDLQVACTPTFLCLSFPLKKGDCSPRVKSLGSFKLMEEHAEQGSFQEQPLFLSWMIGFSLCLWHQGLLPPELHIAVGSDSCVTVLSSKRSPDPSCGRTGKQTPNTRMYQHCSREGTQRSTASLAINRLQPKFSSAGDIISSAGLARGRNGVSLKVSKALRFCFVTDARLVYSSALSLGNLSAGTLQKKRLPFINSRQKASKNDITTIAKQWKKGKEPNFCSEREPRGVSCGSEAWCVQIRMDKWMTLSPLSLGWKGWKQTLEGCPSLRDIKNKSKECGRGYRRNSYHFSINFLRTLEINLRRLVEKRA